MVDPALLEQVVKLGPADRQELFGASFERIDPELAALIDADEADLRAGPDDGQPWEEFRAEFREQYGR
ncbi:MAG: hypothetical protein QM655_05490 [Nocardioidaceae bacterium]